MTAADMTDPPRLSAHRSQHSPIIRRMTMRISESAIRRRLAKAGFRLQKAPARHWSRYYGEGYMVTDDRNTVRLGACQRPYEATLEDVRAFAELM